MLLCLDQVRKKPVRSLKEISLLNIRTFVTEQVLLVSRLDLRIVKFNCTLIQLSRKIVSLYDTHGCVQAGSQYIPLLQEFIFSQASLENIWVELNEVCYVVGCCL